MTKVLACGCKYEYQDKIYGKQLRLHNEAKGKSAKSAWVCTVCGNRKEN
jgi:hypothetical protein